MATAMTAHRRLLRLSRMAQTAILAGVLVAGGVVAHRWFTRWDLTERGEYTLAPATKKLLAGLDDQVVVNAYFSPRLPPYLVHLRRQVQDVLEEYRAFSHGRLDLEFIDPGDDPAAEQRLRALGIPKLQLEVLERDQFQLSNVYLGLVLLHAGRQEVIPVIQDTGNLEYELTAALLRLTSPRKKGVGWLGAPELDPRGRAVDPLRRELGRLYDLRELQAESLTAVPDEVATLVVAGPRELPDRARFAVDQFVMRGGRAVFLVDHFEIPEGSLAAIPSESGVHDLLERYGVKVARDVVGEPRLNAPAAFSSGFMQFRIAYPWWVRVPGDALDRENPATARLEDLVLPWASSLEPVASAGVKATVLAKSSPEAFAVTGSYDFSPQPRGREVGGQKAPAAGRALAVLLTGKFPSFWSDKAPPAAPGTTGEKVRAESPETSLLVIGTSRLAEPEFLRQFPENGAFLLNAIDWMTFGPDLIGIRSRISDERVLGPASERTKAAIKLLNVVGVPLLVALIGIARLNARRRGRSEA
jgi:gliding-associated putative ABC transporter substrate-binding component GldG